MWSSATVDERCGWKRTARTIIAQGLEAGPSRLFLSEDLDAGRDTGARTQIAARVNAGDRRRQRAMRTAWRRVETRASAAQLGTAYLLCPEATTAPYIAPRSNDDRRHTALTNLFTGRPAHRQSRHAEMGPINPSAPAFPLAAPPSPRSVLSRTARSGSFSPLWSGQNASGAGKFPGRADHVAFRPG